jgi:GT2 family glycosyltransferase
MDKNQSLEIQLQLAAQENQHLREQIQWMQTSKFWKLREISLDTKAKLAKLSGRLGIKSILQQVYKRIKEVTADNVTDGSSYSAISKPQSLKWSKEAKDVFANYSTVAFSVFIDSQADLVLPTSNEPIVSIILILYNRAELTYMCLRSLCEHFGAEPFEVIIIDNASSDRTRILLDRVKGANIILNSENIYFPAAVNQGARAAKGKYLLLLNNDAQLLPGSLSSAVKTLESAEDIGVVGGRIILLDGSIQEAGSIIWSDGSCLGYGRGDNPSAPMYMFQRDVDFCSGAFFLTPRDLFFSVGGFDEDYTPAYYEETDYCVKLLKTGKRIVYDPNSVILHYEFASSSSSLNAIELQASHRKLFVRKHSDWLKEQYASNEANILQSRLRSLPGQKKILFIDDKVPHIYMGSGFPRTNKILSALVELGYSITYYPMLRSPDDTWDYIYRDISQVVELVVGSEYAESGLRRFLTTRQDYYDYLLISRPHNLEKIRTIFNKLPRLLHKIKLIYDAEAIFSNRELMKLSLQGSPPSQSYAQSLIEQELQLAEGVDAIITVSELERQQFLDHGYSNVHVLSHMVPIQASETPFEARQDILFVGAMPDDNTPNADSIVWFASKVLPILNQKAEVKIKLLVAGINKAQRVLDLASDQVIILGKVNDLAPLYSTARVFIAPTRFAAGIPLKVCEAAAKGIPIIATNLVATQLGWQSGKELLAADEPEALAECCLQLYNDRDTWNEIRANALEIISQNYSPGKFTKNLEAVIESLQTE